MTTGTTKVGWVGWGAPNTFTFEGHEFPILFDPDVGSMTYLADLCEIHQCGAPEDVLPLLMQSGSGYYDPCSLADYAEDPGKSLVNLECDDLMATLRALSTDWNLAVRFRGWLVDRVFQSSPHRERDEEKWAYYRETGGGPFNSAAECRDYYWNQELKRHHAAQAPTPVKADVLTEAVTADLINRLGKLLREVQERGQCSRQEAAAVIVATVQVMAKGA
jgi:hypothetical protein